MKIDVAAMTKEQKQIAVLAGLVGATLLYAAVAFGILPMLASWKEAKAELAQLTDKLERADRLVRRNHEARGELAETEARVRQGAEAFIPEAENTLAWVTRRIYQQGRDIGVDIESVIPSSSGFQLASLDRATGTYDRFFDYYAVRITTTCGYVKALEFLKALEASNPYLLVAGLVVSSVASDPEQHAVQVDVQWPIWVHPDGADQIRSLEGDTHG